MGFASYVNKLTDNDEWYTPEKAVRIILPHISEHRTIWCPFDKPESEFVKVFTTGGHNVICSHIEDGKDFFLYEPEEPYDAIISNPPWSKKDLIYERLFKIGKPWAMLVGMNGLFDSKKRFNMFREHGCQVLVPDGRTKFIGRTDGKLFAPPFQAVYVCWHLLLETICFEQEDRGLFKEEA